MKRRFLLFTLLAAFAMVIAGCSKDSCSSSSNGGGGNNPTPPTPPTPGNYGTITVAGQNYNIAGGVHEIYYDDDLQQNVVALELADRVDGASNTNGFVVELIGLDNLPSSGSYQFTIQDPMPAGSCGGCFISSQGMLYCSSGTVTVSGTSDNYRIQASGNATPMGGSGNMAFTVNFNGPLPYYEE